MTRVKIRIDDDQKLRERLDEEYEKASKVEMCRFAVALARHVLELAGYQDDGVIEEAICVNEQWQKEKTGVREVRLAAFRVHQKARESEDIIVSTALRATGQAVSTGHVKAHAMAASDYAIKVINLMYPGDMEAVRKERLWQLRTIAEDKNTDRRLI